MKIPGKLIAKGTVAYINADFCQRFSIEVALYRLPGILDCLEGRRECFLF